MRRSFRKWRGRFARVNWSGWPELAYERPKYRERLRVVQEQIAQCLDEAPHTPLRILSMCAGDGRDVIGVLQSDCQRREVEAYLLELNGQSVTAGIKRAKASGLENVIRFIHADATAYSTYRDLAPFDIVLVCGVWGHVPAQDRAKLIRALASFCKPGASVIWTLKISQGEHRLAEVRTQFDTACWSPVRQVLTSDRKLAVCTYVYRGATLEVPANGQIFSFREKAG
jgi:2-polyprenyl-3-methyl-5-hydroxy-6-metoxy-1,4-benzoquinol methylase